MKPTTKLILKIGVSFSLLFFIIQSIDFEMVLSNFKLVDYKFVPIVVLLFILNYYFSSVRWHGLILSERSEEVSVGYLIKLYFVGAFFNNFMPTSIGGDVYKIYKLGQKLGSNAAAFTATFMERFTGVLALVFISYFGLIQTLNFWLSQLPATVLNNQTLVFTFKFILFFGFWIITGFAFLSLKFFSKKIKIVNDIFTAFVKYKSSRRVVVDAVLTSFLVQFVAILSHWYVLQAFDIQINLYYALLIFPVISLAGFFIPSLNGLGVQEALYISFLSQVGVNAESALSASFVYQFIRLGVSLIGGVVYAIDKAD